MARSTNRRSFTRREILQASSGAVWLGSVCGAFPRRLLAAAPEAAAAEMYGADLNDAELRALTQHALNAARDAGAQFADVRINQGLELGFQVGSSAGATGLNLSRAAGIGVRAVVGASWGFAGGLGLTSQAVAYVARLAVRRAKAGSSGKATAEFAFASAPVVADGAWQTPIQIDPFTIPVAQQQELFLDAAREAEKVKGLGSVYATSAWVRRHHVFASSEGSFISQRSFSALPSMSATAERSNGKSRSSGASVDSLPVGGYGYEAVSQTDLKQAWRQAAEEAVRIAAMPVRSVDVGRYDLVLGVGVVADAVTSTIGRALELDRALGEKANGAGTSYAMPPAEILGRYRVASDLLTLTCDRSRPHADATVGWDEEGVKPEEFVLVRDGVVNDYITTRRTAPSIAQWYASQNKPVRSHGCATRTGAERPMLQLPNLTMKADAKGGAVDDLIKGVKRGFYVLGARGSVDQQVLNVQYVGGRVHEIRNGKLVGLASDMAFQFSTSQFWRSLDALGGSDSASLVHVTIDSTPISNVSKCAVHAVPARFRNVNVINTGKQA